MKCRQYVWNNTWNNTYGHIILINAYLPPTRARRTMISELVTIIKCLREDYPNDIMTIVGDFNMSLVRWSRTDETNECSIQNFPQLIKIQKRFFLLMTSYRYTQMNQVANSRRNCFEPLHYEYVDESRRTPSMKLNGSSCNTTWVKGN